MSDQKYLNKPHVCKGDSWIFSRTVKSSTQPTTILGKNLNLNIKKTVGLIGLQRSNMIYLELMICTIIERNMFRI